VGRLFTVFVIVFALIFLIMATLRPWQGGRKNDPDELNHPVKTLAQELRRPAMTARASSLARTT
jgi:hypothetical protein